MHNKNKVISAGPNGFTVYYVDTKRHFDYPYHQPLLSHFKKLHLFEEDKDGLHFERDDFDKEQNRMYKNAVYGLNTYTLEELKEMSLTEKVEIKRLNKTAQQVLNRWKQQIVSRMVDEFLLSLFHRSKLVKQITEDFGDFTSNHQINTLSFSELGITKKDIALKLIEYQVLPVCFFKREVPHRKHIPVYSTKPKVLFINSI